MENLEKILARLKKNWDVRRISMNSSAYSLRLALIALLSLAVHPAMGADEPKAANMKYFEVKMVKADDTDKIVVLADGKELSIALANTLSLSQWPADLSQKQRQLRSEALEFLKNQPLKKKLFFMPAETKGKAELVTRGDLLFLGDGWKGDSPAERVSWGISHLNLAMIQNGFSVYVSDDSVVVPGFPRSKEAQEKRRELFRAAQQFAEQNKKGIWNDREFAQKLVEIAGKDKK